MEIDIPMLIISISVVVGAIILSVLLGVLLYVIDDKGKVVDRINDFLERRKNGKNKRKNNKEN